MLVLSPEYTEYFFGKEVTYLATTFYILEIIRRFIWNCFKIEVKHIEISKRYLMTTDVKLPFQKDELGNCTNAHTMIYIGTKYSVFLRPAAEMI